MHRAAREAHARVQRSRAGIPEQALRARASRLPTPPPLGAALVGPDVAVVGEIKRASPSRGPMAPVADPAQLARAYAAGGAVGVSVLTEPWHFGGSLDDLERVARAVAVPVIRKDFIVDRYQVWEARAAGAAAVLLIVGALDQAVLTGLLRCAGRAGLSALVEVHDAGEAARAARAGDLAPRADMVVGVNARDLGTLAVDPGRFEAVRSQLPSRCPTVAESGVHGPADVARYARLGADAVLVGEHLVTAPDPTTAVAALVAAGRPRNDRSIP
ncbi:MAG: indole-3-glycerol phosphate synthase TrpC [Actinobacteria bacterium]|nr:indole-3-glycerol phosphate synthase TrpC [Actinomycetota bacterium]